MLIDIAKGTLLILSTLVLAGGIVAYVRSRSKASLIAGIVVSVLLDICFVVSITSPTAGLVAGDAVALVLTLLGSVRFRKTRKYMPGGMMMTLGSLTLIIVTLALVRG